ncbi:MAG: L-seryl-tRNA(Sec) selenium transferase [Candidatus Brocadiia bacterium]
MNVLGIPGVDTVLAQPAVQALLDELPREVVVACVRQCVAALRAERQGRGGEEPVPTASETAALLAEEVAARLRSGQRPSLRRVINATGVIVHTNLGRSPLAEEACQALSEVAASYCNLETDLATAERTKRELPVASLLAQLTGAEAATVVNNNAAAVLLTLTALAKGRAVLCSRGELVEIGGSFRMPDVVACSGARMVEVGTTNHTRLGDYQAALDEHTAAVLKTHRSNFRLVGFTSEVPVAPLAELAHEAGVPLIHDAGSGLLLPMGEPAFPHEPVVRQAVADGADVVTFSTDKLLGGPQGGAIVGRQHLLERIDRHPLKRAVRVGKLTLAALEAALHAHLRPDGVPATVTMRLIRRPVAELEAEARRLADAIRQAAPRWSLSIEPDECSIGGGSLPGETVPTVVLWLHAPGMSADELGAALRAGEPAVLGRYRAGRFGLDLRTLLPGDADDVARCVEQLAAGGGNGRPPAPADPPSPSAGPSA